MKKLILATLFLVACGTPISNQIVIPSLSNTPVTCQPTDQDQYIYNPDRLKVQLPCLRVSGTVDFVRTEADGDFHLGLKLDPQYAQYVNSCNSTCVNGAEHGDLVIEPVCANRVTQADAVAVCSKDPDPLKSVPSVGQHVWMEGRYVLDMDHGGWAELHSLYRWGVA
jgi:hypothetical protein